MGKSKSDIRIEELGGNCPVQAEGFVGDEPFYFRARGEHWTMSIGGDPVEKPKWEHEEYYGEWPSAGWISDDEAEAFIKKAVKIYDRQRS